jgi:hypothetical protein
MAWGISIHPMALSGTARANATKGTNFQKQGSPLMGSDRNNRRVRKREQSKLIKAAIKYDLEGCDVCGHQPTGREVYLIGQIGKRVVGVCRHHIRSLDIGLSLQFYQEGAENKKRREMTEAASTNGPKH